MPDRPYNPNDPLDDACRVCGVKVGCDDHLFREYVDDSGRIRVARMHPQCRDPIEVNKGGQNDASGSQD